MCSTTASPGHHPPAAHGSPRRPRALRIAPDSPSRLLRTAQSARCLHCGNPLHWYTRTTQQPIALHPQELNTAAVPHPYRWHVDGGIAHPAHDGSAWCRITHRTLCPAAQSPTPLTPPLVELRRSLALRTRRLTDTGAFASPLLSAPPSAKAETCRPVRPIVQMLCSRYLAARPLDAIQCIAQTRRRRRCPQPVLTADASAGEWRLLPAGSRQHATPASGMAVYDLAHLPYTEQLRWRTQYCPAHAGAPDAAHLALAEWEVFDLRLHHEHAHSRLPAVVRHRRTKTS
ncbi:DUF6083 domain-containing protein [Streptomyces sp. H27-D2]|uniref:DUF6083 domain-containing protein n=1 Tax=Streptomyces sp. H27-D2 TaxID=3046304 RepID=UPI002DBFF4D6|nr:DUF6083 domain-containing protein [Streptomyces sp. H27-D2]MEC4020339.1 DUF6083 domain-containing protein [Streptomyces sp. H27-D2]